jgi:hypothetical protein
VPLPPPPYLPPPATGASSSVSVSSDPFALHQQKWYLENELRNLQHPFVLLDRVSFSFILLFPFPRSIFALYFFISLHSCISSYYIRAINRYEQPGWGRLVSPFEWKEPLPPLIEAWRKCKVNTAPFKPCVRLAPLCFGLVISLD